MEFGMLNYYILLELPFDPPVDDPARIKEALRIKKQEWTRWQDNPARRGVALRYLELAPEIERVMLDPKGRAEQAELARGLRGEMLRRFEAELRVLEGKGYLLPREVTALQGKYGVWGVDREGIHQRANVPVGEDAPELASQDEDEPGEVIDRITAASIRRALSVVGEPDLYAFLGLKPYSAVKKLLAAAEDKRREAAASATKGAKASAAQELSGICLRLFADIPTKQSYDRYLKVSKYPELGDLIDQEYVRSNYIDDGILLRLINFSVETSGIGVLEAEAYIRAYCTTYRIPIGTPDRTAACPHCGSTAPQEAVVCPSCAAPLRGECPGCGTGFSGGMQICPECGFALGDMGKALRHISDAQNALIENNWSTAQRNLQYARKYWPGHPQLAPLAKRAEVLEKRYAQYVDTIGDCARNNQYYAALELVEEAEDKGIRLPPRLAEGVRGAIADFEAKLHAVVSADKAPRVEAILDLATVITDSIELGRLMKQHPPAPPRTLHAAIDGMHVRLRWEPSTSAGMVDYVLVRKKGGYAITAFDGDILYEGPAASFEDRFTEPLVAYCYSVFSKRSGAYSREGASAQPVRIIPELQNLRILPSDGGAQLTWDFHPAIQEVLIWRKLGGERPSGPEDGFQLQNTRVDGYSDTKIKNDVEYWYYAVAVYAVGDERVQSSGVCDSVIPHKFVAPMTGLAVVGSDIAEDCYLVNWNNPQLSDIMLLASTRKPGVRPGDVVHVQDLVTDYRRLDLEMRGETSAQFRYAFSGGAYIIPAALTGRFASIGRIQYLINVQEVENPGWDRIGKDAYINMKWPVGLGQVVVCYRVDGYPESPDEVGASTIRCSKEQYDYDAAVVLREPEEIVYYAKIFSAFTTPDGKIVYSQGVELEIDNRGQQEVFYQFLYKKPPLSKRAKVTVTVTSLDEFLLPQAEFVGKVGRLPLGKTDGISLFEVERETRVDGEISFQFDSEALPDNLYVRMFLHDERQYDLYRLLPQNSPKIS